MSTVRKDYGVEYEINAGTTKVFEIILEDADGNIINMSDSDVYNTGKVKIVKPDGTIVGNVSIVFSDRTNGKMEFTVTDTTATNTNAGNWIGELEILNNASQTVEQRKFNLNILESY